MNEGQVIILSAPSGTGKTTLLKRVMANLEGLAFSVSHTTRKPREGEQDGIAYHFVTRDQFLGMIDADEFLEYAEVHGNFYGTSKKTVLQQVGDGVDVILDIDVQGARILRGERTMRGVFIFLAPPSLVELEKRLNARGLDDAKTVATRLANACGEMEAMAEYQYLVVNDDLDDASRMLEGIILAERAKYRRGIHGKSLEIEVG